MNLDKALSMYDRHQSLRNKLDRTLTFERECCNDTNNLKYAYDLNKDADKCVLRCKHCGAVHRRVYVDGGALGLKL
jgi:hypothetical protein